MQLTWQAEILTQRNQILKKMSSAILRLINLIWVLTS